MRRKFRWLGKSSIIGESIRNIFIRSIYLFNTLNCSGGDKETLLRAYKGVRELFKKEWGFICALEDDEEEQLWREVRPFLFIDAASHRIVARIILFDRSHIYCIATVDRDADAIVVLILTLDVSLYSTSAFLDSWSIALLPPTCLLILLADIIFCQVKNQANQGRNNDKSTLKSRTHKIVLKKGILDINDDDRGNFGIDHPDLLRMIVPMSILYKHGKDPS